MSQTVSDTPRPFQPAITQRDIETEVAQCVGGVNSPLLSNVALSVLDEHIAQAPGGPATSNWERTKRRRHGLPTYRLVRFAYDWCLMVNGTKTDAEALREEIAGVLARWAYAYHRRRP